MKALALLLALLPTSCVAPQAPEASVKPGINDSFLAEDLDVDRFVARFEVESREIYVEREAIAAALGLEPGDEVADIGAGTGLFEPLFSAAVGAEGTVYAVELSPGMLDHLRERKEAEGWSNVVVHGCSDRDLGLPRHSLDAVFICDTYHHFEYPRSTMESVRRALRPGGEVLLVDFERIPGVSRPWVLDHVRCGKEAVIAEMTAFGFTLVEEVALDGLEENYVLRFRRE